MSDSKTRRSIVPAVQSKAILMFKFFWTLLAKNEKKEIFRKIKTIGKLNNLDIIKELNILTGKIQVGGTISQYGLSYNSLMRFVLILACFLYISARVGANTPVLFEKIIPIRDIPDNKQTQIFFHEKARMDILRSLTTPFDNIEIYEDVKNEYEKGWQALTIAYPREATMFEEFNTLYEEEGCAIDGSKTVFRTGMKPSDVLTKIQKYIRLLHPLMTEEDIDTLNRVAADYILSIPSGQLNEKIVCSFTKETMLLLFSREAEKRIKQEAKEALETSYVEPVTKDEVDSMFNNILLFIRGNPFGITLGLLLTLVFTTRLYNRLNKTKKMKQKIIQSRPIITDASKYLSDIYGSSDDEKDIKSTTTSKTQKPFKPSLQDQEREEYEKALREATLREATLREVKKINKTPSNTTHRSLSRTRKRVGI